MTDCSRIKITGVNIRGKKSCKERLRQQSIDQSNGGNSILRWKYLKSIWRIGKEDPRRGIHSFKVALALDIVSLLYLIGPLSKLFGPNSSWAVVTVVLVFEFSAGSATLSKGLNRGAGTLVAGLLAVGVECAAQRAGDIGRSIIVACIVFILGAGTTFCRFIPQIKRNYDYGAVIFLLTFNLVTGSGYRDESIFRVAFQRLATIVIGCGVCFVICLFICPIWAGHDLHCLVIRNLERLADSFQESVEEYFEDLRHCTHLMRSHEDPIFRAYQSVLESKTTEESLANFASWETMHRGFGFRYPWKQYLKIGSMLRHVAYCMVALHDCLLSEIQAPNSLRAQLKAPCIRISTEARIILQELAQNIADMRRNRPTALMLRNLISAAEDLQADMRAQPELFIDTEKWSIAEEITIDNNNEGDIDAVPHESLHEPCTDPEVQHARLRRYLSMPVKEFSNRNNPRGTANYRLKEKKHCVTFLEALPLATFASLLMEIVARLEHIIVAVDELGNLANFKSNACSEQQLQQKCDDLFMLAHTTAPQ